MGTPQESLRSFVPTDQPLGSERVLILAPTGKDAELAARVLLQAKFETNICRDLTSLRKSVRIDSDSANSDYDVGAILLADEALIDDNGAEIVRLLREQPAWSDIPVVILTSGDEASQASLRVSDIFGSSGNVTLLERPLKSVTLISSLHVALRSRRRQYQMRALIDELHQHADSLREQKSELELARMEAESANNMKDQFLATLSHELRTPLNAILGWGQILADDLKARSGSGDFTVFEQGLEVIERNARVQAQLIEDLLDVSRIISGKLKIEEKPVNLCSVVETALESTRPIAEARDIAISTKLTARHPIVNGDFARLQQIVLNLLSNSIKFTPHGGKVDVRLFENDQNLHLKVRDSGQGISAEFLPHVFERFRQADATSTRQHGGLGLGLSIVRQLTNYHKGSITVHSDGIGKGSEFEIILPMAPEVSLAETIDTVQTPANEFSNGEDLTGLRILVVDNEEDARELIKRMLLEAHAEVEVASSVEEALIAVNRKKPNIIVSDIGMPVQDGYDLIREIRNSPDGISKLPAVAVTAFASAEDRVRSEVSGFQAHLSKPIDAKELRCTVAKYAAVGRVEAGDTR